MNHVRKALIRGAAHAEKQFGGILAPLARAHIAEYAADYLALTFEDDWEPETHCRSCGKDVSPKRLGVGGYCSACLLDAMGSPEEALREMQEWEDEKQRIRERDMPEQARDVLRGRTTVEKAALACYISVQDMQAEVDYWRAEEERIAYAEYLSERSLPNP